MRKHALAFTVLAFTLSGCALLPLEEDPPPPVSSAYLCEEGRTFNAWFDPDGRKVSLMLEGSTKLLYRLKNDEPVVFANRGISLKIQGEPVPLIWVERNGIAVYRNCHQAGPVD